MDDLTRRIRLENDYDHQVLSWLRREVGDDAIRAALQRMDGQNPPYPTALCRALDIQPPPRRVFRTEAARADRAVGDRYLARIREILSGSQPADAAKEGTGSARARHSRQRSLPFGGTSGPWQMA